MIGEREEEDEANIVIGNNFMIKKSKKSKTLEFPNSEHETRTICILYTNRSCVVKGVISQYGYFFNERHKLIQWTTSFFKSTYIEYI